MHTETIGIGFMFAPNHHPAMKNVGTGAQGTGRAHHLQHPGAADQSGRRPNILMGVFHPDLVGIQVRVLQRLGAEHAVVVYGKTAWTRCRWARRRWSASCKRRRRSSSTRFTRRTSA
jgi:anthranilate phosphoribosyltransferase